MSFQALGWAVDQKPSKPADKLILLGLADRHNTEYRMAWPSTAWLVDFTGHDRKTVIAGLKRLVEAGLIYDTGKRAGKTKQIVGYGLAFDRPADGEEQPGTVPKTEASQKRNGSVFPAKASQKRDTEPIREPITSKASPSRVSASASAKQSKTECPDDFWPKPSEGSKTFERTSRLAENGLLEEQVEKFIAYHQTRGHKYKNWQQCWTTWVTNNFDGRSIQNGNSNDPGAARFGNPMVRAAVERATERRRPARNDSF